MQAECATSNAKYSAVRRWIRPTIVIELTWYQQVFPSPGNNVAGSGKSCRSGCRSKLHSTLQRSSQPNHACRTDIPRIPIRGDVVAWLTRWPNRPDDADPAHRIGVHSLRRRVVYHAIWHDRPRGPRPAMGSPIRAKQSLLICNAEMTCIHLYRLDGGGSYLTNMHFIGSWQKRRNCNNLKRALSF